MQDVEDRAETVRCCELETPLGRLLVGYRGGTIVASAFNESLWRFGGRLRGAGAGRVDREKAPPPAIRGAVLAQIAGDTDAAPLDLAGLRPFQRRVLEKVREIPPGERRSYGWVANAIGAPRAARAVGTALARNPFPILVPCHRVVRADGAVGRYSGGGATVKAHLLALESVAANGRSRSERPL